MSLLKLTDELFIDLTDVSLITTGEKTETPLNQWGSNTDFKLIVIKFKDGRTELLKFKQHDKDAMASYENVLEKINLTYDKQFINDKL